MNVEFSIVIPVYNAASTLHETLQSVVSQSYPHFEVICINDGSSDKSLKILESWKAEHPQLNINIVSKANGGLASARNRGIQQASNPWIALLDADDIWLSIKLETIAKQLQAKDLDIIYHSVKTFGLKASRVRKAFQIESLYDILLKGNPIIPSAVIGKAELFREYPFDEEKNILRAEDIDLWIRLLHAKKEFQHLPLPLTLYRETGGMSSDIDTHFKCVMTVLDKYAQKGWYSEDLLLRAKKRKWLEAGRFYQKHGNFKQAGLYYAKSKAATPKLLVFRLLNFLHISL